MESSKELLLVYKNMPKQSLANTVNIMLTPQFYNLKKEVLPRKYAFQVKKIAASLFDGLLEKPEKYEYLVYKEGEVWNFIAYDLEEINHFLVSKGIKVEQVGKIFFAQQALSSFSAPVFLGAKDALVAIDDSVVLVPQTALKEDEESLRIDKSFTPKNGIALQGSFNSIISQKQAMGLAALFALFAMVFFVEGWRYGNDSQAAQAEIEDLIEKYPALQSQYTRQSIAQKYRIIDKNEKRKRDIVKILSGMIFKGVEVETFKMDEKGFTVRFQCTDAKVVKRLKELSKSEGFSAVKTLTGNIVQIGDKI